MPARRMRALRSSRGVGGRRGARHGAAAVTTAEWTTPPDLFEAITECWGPFDLDAAATADNALLANFLTPEIDALSVEWGDYGGFPFVNPPYGRTNRRWIRHMLRQAMPWQRRPVPVVALMPASVGSRWWSDYVLWANEIVILTGRVKFGGADVGAPFDSAVVVWRPPGLGLVPRRPFNWPHWRIR